MIGALSEFGKIGLTAIANTPREADTLFDRAVEILDAEPGYGQPPTESGG